MLTHGSAPDFARPKRDKASRQLLAAALGVLPLYSGLLAHQLARDEPLAIHEFVFYLAVIAPLAILIALLLLRFLCGEDYRSLNLKPGTLIADLLAALILVPLILLANVVSHAILPAAAADTSIRDVFVEIGSDPSQLLVFVGPLLLLGAASEELIRAFLLSRLWNIWSSTTGKLIVVVFSAVLFGLIHLYRGWVHVTWAAIFGLIMALYYLRFGRTAPLVLAHYATNAIQVVVIVAMVS